MEAWDSIRVETLSCLGRKMAQLEKRNHIVEPESNMIVRLPQRWKFPIYSSISYTRVKYYYYSTKPLLLA